LKPENKLIGILSELKAVILFLWRKVFRPKVTIPQCWMDRSLEQFHQSSRFAEVINRESLAHRVNVDPVPPIPKGGPVNNRNPF
jgi:hypothetical protein